MNGLSKFAWRMSLAGVAVAAMAGLASCNEAPSPAPPPPPAATYQPPAPPPALLGAPPPRQFTAMAPIPNPPAHGHGAHHWRHRHGDHSPGWWLRAHGYGAGAPRVHAAAPAPVAAPPPRIVAAPRPVVAPPLVAAPTPLARLSSAVSDKWKGATLSAPTDLSAKKPGAVTLSLPADLLTVIRQEAAKLGLGRTAKKTEVTATLHGEGYTVTPPGPQTASLAPGKPTTFTWQVTPGPNAKGPLRADVNAVLKGAGDAQSFTLAKLKQAIAAVDAAVAAAKAAHGFKLPSLDMLTIPGHKDVALPVVGKTPSGSVVGALIVLAILFLLALFARGSTNRRESAASRRRYRTMAATPVLGLADEPHAEPVLAPAVEHEHPVEAPVSHAHEADHHAPEPPPRYYEGPDLAAEHHAVDDGHADHHAEAEPAAEHHAHAEHVVEQHAEAHHALEPAVADAHGHAEPVAEGDYMLIGELGQAADHRTVVHAVDDHAETHAAESHGDDHAGDHGHNDHHQGHGEHRHLELESI
jgi:hypothetical protein